MHTIVVGCGRIGSEIARVLSTSGCDVVVVDSNAAAFKRLGSAFNGLTIRGQGTDEAVLKEAGIEAADSLAAATNSDAVNMMAAQIASRIYRVPRVLVRLYLPGKEQTARILGLQYVADASLTARAMLSKLSPDGSSNPRGEPETLEFTAGPQADGRRVLDLQVPGELRICLVTRGGESFIPWRDTKLREHDVVLAMARPAALGRIDRLKRPR